jgi:hypothetical protein
MEEEEVLIWRKYGGVNVGEGERREGGISFFSGRGEEK